ncbi:MAG: DUF2783 domain-containing protein [Burkholderiales bacterium]|jgi:hypothetical protein|nr:DUF2783 domain-containing protein [Burkholderiales bacterium]
MPLTLEPNFAEPGRHYFRDFSPGDDFYQLLIDAHRDLTDEQSALLNAKLVLLLANHVGDLGVIGEALQRAREDVAGT